ncbi:MAG: glycoside hydrolase family 15 protein [Actinomycetota bacterium]|nr:glycoside hydrolase family 15 protein [Actinomycetota bacterium]
MALVGNNGSVDWLCLPRFDSAACLAALLGDEDNGRWQLCPRGLADGAVVRTSRRYRPGTLVLETEWETATGVVRITDAMPPRDGHASMVRRIEGVSGEVEMAMRLTVRFAYGSATPWMRRITCPDGTLGLLAVAGPDALLLHGAVLPEADRREHNRAHHAYVTVRAGERLDYTLSWFPSDQEPPHAHDVGRGIEQTDHFWTEWSGRAHDDGPYAEAVQRSLITLKALTYQPTGGIVAAPTTSLPEALGGTRNWDYRLCWLRDATLVLLALVSAGYTEEAGAWREWLMRAVAGAPDELQIVYGLGGERMLTEVELPWLAGYEGSRPVRVGNEAATQFQLDVYGEVLSAMYAAQRAGLGGDAFSWSVQRAVLGHLEAVMDQPDNGIWEVRGPRRHFTHSRVMVWVAFDRAVRSAEEFGLDGPVERWRELRDQVHAQVCDLGWNESVGAFTQSFGSTDLDAAVLIMPIVGFLPGDDPRVVATVDAISRTLRHGALVDRYQTHPDVDGLPAGEGSFLACSFWLVSSLALAGRTKEATELFDELLALRNDVGLLAEEYDGPQHRMTGNFPQAFSHLALVEAAGILRRVAEGGSLTGEAGTTSRAAQ